MKKIGKRTVVMCLGILLLSAFMLPTQENTIFQRILGKLTTYSIRESPEKIYLQTDKDFYTNEETIWFKTYLLDGISHTASTKSKVVYVALLDKNDSIISQRKLYTDSLNAMGDIRLGKNIEQGTYTLRSYTKYMLNEKEPLFFEKELPIWVQDSSGNNAPAKNLTPAPKENTKSLNSEIQSPQLQFFPEGGNLVSGTKNTLGIKATDSNGNGIALKGKIIDEEGVAIVFFETYDFGLSTTRFAPEEGKAYYASITSNGVEKKIPLPRSMSNGYVLNVENNGDHMLVRVFSNTNDGLEGTMLLGHLRGDLFLKQVGAKSEQDSYAIKLITNELDDGVAQFTLFTADGEPVCERLVFIDNPDNDTALSITTDTAGYGPRDLVEVNMALNGANGVQLQGDFSMSVVTGSTVLKEDRQASNIKSWLLLNSDLGGTVSDPDYFFEDDSTSRKYLLDALMLTHGWRRFVWKDLVSTNVNKTLAFAPEKGIMINGKTTAFENKYQPKQTLATLNIFKDGIYQEKKLTNAQGEFSFGPFSFQDSIRAVIQAADPEEQKITDFSIYPSAPSPLGIISYGTKARATAHTVTYPQEYLDEAYRKKVADFKYDPKVTALEEVVVTSKKKTKRELINEEINAMTLYGNAHTRIFTDSISGMEAASALDIIRRIAGVQVFGAYPNQKATIRGASSFVLSSDPLYLVDGVQVPADVVRFMTASEVLFVDVLKGSEGAIYGSRGANGVVAIYTNIALTTTLGSERYPGVTNLKIPGFYKTREFYAPNYGISKPEHARPDYRTTLHWQPRITFDKDGKATVRFFTGDATGSYRIKVEGVTTDGRPVNGSHTFTVSAKN